MKKVFLGAVVGGVLLLLATAILLTSASRQQTPASPNQTSLQARLENALQAGEPTFVFMHSLTCESCQEMMGVAAQVMPEFEGDVTLIDVNVDEPANLALLRKERLQMIPTEVFYDRGGNRQEVVGVMTAEQLRTALNALRSQSNQSSK